MKETSDIHNGEARCCRQCYRSYMRQWRDRNRSKLSVYARTHYVKNRDRKVEDVRSYRRTASAKAKRREWKLRNKDRIKVYEANKQINRRRAKGSGRIRVLEWRELVAKFNSQCAYCKAGNVALTMDHVVPLSRGGLHRIENIVPACLQCNSRKQAMDAVAFQKIIELAKI
jgi:5-methylcytosine-specific restriction endonuclease McrA